MDLCRWTNWSFIAYTISNLIQLDNNKDKLV